MLTYGNGLKVKYEYDALDRIEKIQYNIGTNKAFVDVYSYEYYADGKLYTVTDHVLDEMTQYIYDAAGKLTGTTLFDVSGQATEQYASSVHYDSRDRLSQVEFDLKYRAGTTTVQDTRFNFYYYLENDRLQTYHTAFADTMINVAPVYDSFGRVQSRTVTGKKSNADAFYNKISYQFISSGNNQSAIVSQYKSEAGKTSSTATETVFNYTYDANGNITSITDASGALLYQYYYDELGQLDQERNAPLGYIYSWVYDDSGNITAKRTFSYTNGTVGSLVSTINYTYGNSAWGDQLTKYGNTSITYDSIGNPITIGSDTLTWQGRQLMSHTVDGWLEMTYKYNADGVRTHKTAYDLDVDDYTEHEYILNGTQIVAEIIDNYTTLIYLYDENGAPIGMKYRTAAYAAGVFDTFFFEKNLQGDVIAVYDSNGTKLISYTYDAWGNFRTTYVTTGTTALGKALRNPFKYRGYYYDNDTGWYYLQTRYYNPTWGRFINADGYVNANGTLTGFNMYAYCDNNPVILVDYTGESAYLVIDYDELPIAGHALVFFEDANGVWYRSEVGKHSDFNMYFAVFFPFRKKGEVTLIEVDKISGSRTLQNYLNGTRNADVYYIEGDFSKSYDFAKRSERYDYPYIFPYNNCLTYALDLLLLGEISSSFLGKKLLQERNRMPQIPAWASLNVASAISLLESARNTNRNPSGGPSFKGGTICAQYR